MPPNLRTGARGPDVVALQMQLNVRATSPSSRLSVDGAFGPRTQAAVMNFQRQVPLSPVDGIVGPATRAALDKVSTAPKVITHAMMHIAQPTPTTCWAASTAMMTRSSVPQVIAKTPPVMVAADGGLLNSSDSDQAVVTGSAYGAVHNLVCHAPMSWSVPGLLGVLRRSPIMIDTLWNAAEYSQGSGSPGHMTVVSSAVSDEQPNGAGTYLQVLDPWPPHQGKVYWVEYGRWVRDVPTRTYRVFERV